MRRRASRNLRRVSESDGSTRSSGRLREIAVEVDLALDCSCREVPWDRECSGLRPTSHWYATRRRAYAREDDVVPGKVEPHLQWAVGGTHGSHGDAGLASRRKREPERVRP